MTTVTRDAPRNNVVDERSGRQALLARWLELTRHVLPAMAATHAWPIRANHCFMRVCLDVSLGQAWPTAVRAPAIRHMSDAQLAAALAVAESIVETPDKLPVLNRESLGYRRAWRDARR